MSAMAQSASGIKGKVMCQGKGISNVVVTNGFDCVLTDTKGMYSLPYHRDARFVYVTTPAGYLLPFLEKYHEKYPHIKVTVTNAPTPETRQLLKEDQIDFGLITSPFEEQEELETFPVKEIEDCFVAGRKFIQYKNKMLDLQELEKLPLICLEKNTSTRKYMDAFLEQNHVSLAPEFELATSDMIVQFALRNLGIGCVMKDFALEALESGDLFELCFTPVIPPRSFYLVHRETGSLAPAARKFITLFP